MKGNKDINQYRICKCGCGKKFIPSRDWQVFYPNHRQRYWKEVYSNKRNLADKISSLEKRLQKLERT